MSKKRRLERLEGRLRVGKKKEAFAFVPFGCPLKEEERGKCKIYQEKEKTAEIIFCTPIPRPPGTEDPTGDCLEKCPYASK